MSCLCPAREDPILQAVHDSETICFGLEILSDSIIRPECMRRQLSIGTCLDSGYNRHLRVLFKIRQKFDDERLLELNIRIGYCNHIDMEIVQASLKVS